MATWSDVDRRCRRLPDAVLGEAHEGSPAWYAGRHPFARLRWDDEGRELLQFWSGDLGLADALAGRRETFPYVAVFRHRVSVWSVLEGLDARELAELLLDSYRIRGGVRRGEAVDEDAYFG